MEETTMSAVEEVMETMTPEIQIPEEVRVMTDVEVGKKVSVILLTVGALTTGAVGIYVLRKKLKKKKINDVRKNEDKEEEYGYEQDAPESEIED